MQIFRFPKARESAQIYNIMLSLCLFKERVKYKKDKKLVDQTCCGDFRVEKETLKQQIDEKNKLLAQAAAAIEEMEREKSLVENQLNSQLNLNTALQQQVRNSLSSFFQARRSTRDCLELFTASDLCDIEARASTVQSPYGVFLVVQQYTKLFPTDFCVS